MKKVYKIYRKDDPGWGLHTISVVNAVHKERVKHIIGNFNPKKGYAYKSHGDIFLLFDFRDVIIHFSISKEVAKANYEISEEPTEIELSKLLIPCKVIYGSI